MSQNTFTCPLCGKIYVKQKALVNHMQFSHGNEFECKTCGAKLSSKARLARHSQSKSCNIKIAKKGKKKYNIFVCHFCQETFTKKSELNKHFKINHKPKRKLKIKKTKLPASREYFENDQDAIPCLHNTATDETERDAIKDTWT